MSLLIAMFSFSLTMSISPGPVNMIIISSGMNYGVRKTLPFVSGGTIGFTLLLLFIGLGFSQVINSYPSFLKYLTVVGSSFIIYMGYLIATSDPELDIEKQHQPTFLQGFILQWLNPKAWIACLAGASLFSVPNSSKEFLLFSLIYFVVCYLSLFCWSVLGDKSAKLLNSKFKLKLFNLSMGGALIVTASYLLYSQFN
ncbi:MULTISPECIES: LysE family translocator [Pseudoalteromonas]|uniref:LysE family translocator n=1 Tax=Pseudoalteromonas undina TaxID=43660 RepID=A0ACC6R8L1_9GAMM|nr:MULTISPECIES: LysE family translocator [unclassified Pseudoalteromonas]KPZ51573.1 Cysteine/O-acetylserine efflux protein [Pseudoalteromonas sp. P1-25]KPZ51596.1 Cysteine/O-acetylserine efflux protein [Pseudoalteromonas sp. P1-13-1a]KPZ51902.1 Cysteine/O-acetylserine efflux protein [Pseudoalteromonas sp. P1-7a]